MGSAGRTKSHTDGNLYRDLNVRARMMRKHPTPAEDQLWQHLRRNQLAGFHFRRQHPIVRHIVDFYCAEARLVVEVDGAIHDRPGQDEYDIERQGVLETLGLRVIRFKNDEVTQRIGCVLKAIVDALESTPPPNPPPHRDGEGG